LEWTIYAMPRSLMTVKEVAASLHVSPREVVRMAERAILPSIRVKGQWQFRAGEVWNWIEQNVHSLPAQRERDPHPTSAMELLVAPALKEQAVAVNLVAKTKSSVLRSLVDLAAQADPTIDGPALVEALMDREGQGSTALQYGVAVPHPSRPFYSEGPLLAAARTSQGVCFGERQGGLSDLFFLVCCPDQTQHLLYFGRLCRLLLDASLRKRLREADDATAFHDALTDAESALCHSD